MLCAQCMTVSKRKITRYQGDMSTAPLDSQPRVADVNHVEMRWRETQMQLLAGSSIHWGRASARWYTPLVLNWFTIPIYSGDK